MFQFRWPSWPQDYRQCSEDIAANTATLIRNWHPLDICYAFCKPASAFQSTLPTSSLHGRLLSTKWQVDDKDILHGIAQLNSIGSFAESLRLRAAIHLEETRKSIDVTVRYSSDVGHAECKPTTMSINMIQPAKESCAWCKCLSYSRGQYCSRALETLDTSSCSSARLLFQDLCIGKHRSENKQLEQTSSKSKILSEMLRFDAQFARATSVLERSRIRVHKPLASSAMVPSVL